MTMLNFRAREYRMERYGSFCRHILGMKTNESLKVFSKTLKDIHSQRQAILRLSIRSILRSRELLKKSIKGMKRFYCIRSPDGKFNFCNRNGKVLSFKTVEKANEYKKIVNFKSLILLVEGE